jgi:hypothetical protein
LPPDMMKLPNTQPNSTTMPIIWNKGFSRRCADHRRYCLISGGRAFRFARARRDHDAVRPYRLIVES